MDTVVVGFDGSEGARGALTRAAEVAGARLVVVIDEALPNPQPHLPSVGVVYPLTKPGSVPDDVRALLHDHRGSVDYFHARGDAAAALVEVAREQDASLVVVADKRRHGLGRITGSETHFAVDHAPCDVLVVREHSSRE